MGRPTEGSREADPQGTRQEEEGLRMARRGDGINLLGRTRLLDLIHQGKRNTVPLGKNISRRRARGLQPPDAL